MFRLFLVMPTGCKSLSINYTPSLSFFQLFIFIATATQRIDPAQFIESKGDCLLFFLYIMKYIHGGLTAPHRPPTEKLIHENFAHAYINIGNSIL